MLQYKTFEGACDAAKSITQICMHKDNVNCVDIVIVNQMYKDAFYSIHIGLEIEPTDFLRWRISSRLRMANIVSNNLPANMFFHNKQNLTN